MEMPAPDLPCIALVGSREKIVEPQAIERRMQNWPKGRFTVINGAEHEVLMEAPAQRAATLAAIVGLFDANA